MYRTLWITSLNIIQTNPEQMIFYSSYNEKIFRLFSDDELDIPYKVPYLLAILGFVLFFILLKKLVEEKNDIMMGSLLKGKTIKYYFQNILAFILTLVLNNIFIGIISIVLMDRYYYSNIKIYHYLKILISSNLYFSWGMVSLYIAFKFLDIDVKLSVKKYLRGLIHIFILFLGITTIVSPFLKLSVYGGIINSIEDIGITKAFIGIGIFIFILFIFYCMILFINFQIIEILKNSNISTVDILKKSLEGVKSFINLKVIVFLLIITSYILIYLGYDMIYNFSLGLESLILYFIWGYSILFLIEKSREY